LKYTAPIRRGFGYMHDLLALSLSANPAVPPHPASLAFIRSLTDMQRKDLTAAINYTASEYNTELAKFGLPPAARNPSMIAPSSPAPALPVSGPSSDSDANASDVDGDPAPETDESNPSPTDD